MARIKQTLVLDVIESTAADDETAGGYIQLAQGLAGKGIKLTDISGWKSEAYAAGVIHSVDVELNGISLAANREYTITVKFLKNVLQSYTFSAIYTSAPASEAVVAQALVDKINETDALGFSAALVNTDEVRITADSVALGEMLVTNSEGAAVTDNAAFVAGIGTSDDIEAKGGVGIAAKEYDRITINWSERSRSNAVSGAVVLVPVTTYIFGNKTDESTDWTALKASLVNTLDGTTAANWAGAPEL